MNDKRAHTSWQGRPYVKKRAHLEVFEDRQANVRVAQQPIFDTGVEMSEKKAPVQELIEVLQRRAQLARFAALGCLAVLTCAFAGGLLMFYQANEFVDYGNIQAVKCSTCNAGCQACTANGCLVCVGSMYLDTVALKCV